MSRTLGGSYSTARQLFFNLVLGERFDRLASKPALGIRGINKAKGSISPPNADQHVMPGIKHGSSKGWSPE